MDVRVNFEYTSKTFIKHIQNKIKEYKEEYEEIEIDEFFEWLGVSPNHGFIEDLSY